MDSDTAAVVLHDARMMYRYVDCGGKYAVRDGTQDMQVQDWVEFISNSYFKSSVHTVAMKLDDTPRQQNKAGEEGLEVRIMTSEKLQGDRKVVLAAMKLNVLALQYASKELCAVTGSLS